MTATASSISPRPLGQLLLRGGVIRAEQLDRALAEQRRCRHRELLGEALVDLRGCTGPRVSGALAESYGITFGIRRAARSAAAVPQPAHPLNRVADVATPEALDAAYEGGQAEKLLNFCLYTALKEGATAVHFEPGQDSSPRSMAEPARGIARVRFRVDGVMVEKRREPPGLHDALAIRLKTAAGMDARQSRMPQHGRLRATFDGKGVDLE